MRRRDRPRRRCRPVGQPARLARRADRGPVRRGQERPGAAAARARAGGWWPTTTSMSGPRAGRSTAARPTRIAGRIEARGLGVVRRLRAARCAAGPGRATASSRRRRTPAGPGDSEPRGRSPALLRLWPLEASAVEKVAPRHRPALTRRGLGAIQAGLRRGARARPRHRGSRALVRCRHDRARDRHPRAGWRRNSSPPWSMWSGPQRGVAAICIGPEDDMERRRRDILDAAAAVDDGDGRHPADRHVRRHARPTWPSR